MGFNSGFKGLSSHYGIGSIPLLVCILGQMCSLHIFTPHSLSVHLCSNHTTLFLYVGRPQYWQWITYRNAYLHWYSTAYDRDPLPFSLVAEWNMNIFQRCCWQCTYVIPTLSDRQPQNDRFSDLVYQWRSL